MKEGKKGVGHLYLYVDWHLAPKGHRKSPNSQQLRFKVFAIELLLQTLSDLRAIGGNTLGKLLNLNMLNLELIEVHWNASGFAKEWGQ